MNKILNFKIVGFLFLLLIGVVSLLFYLNFYKFESIFFEKKWKFIQNKVEKKNAQIIQNQDLGNIFFEKSKYNFIKISLQKFGLFYRDDYIYRPLGYIDLFQDRIIFAAHDGTFYFTNKISEIKKGTNKISKFNKTNFDFKFNIEDEDPYRNILIRDIMIDEENLYVVINGRDKIGKDQFSLSTIVLKGKIDLENKEIYFEKFFDPGEKIVGSTDFSHSGGRIVKYKSDNFLLTVPDHALMDDYESLSKRISSDKSIIGKILILKNNNYKIFSRGHRNPQGLFYDKKNDLIFETEHGPTGGDEINLIKKDSHYGWPIATYGAKIPNLNKFRNHEQNNFTEPLAYWWPRNCGMSEIIKPNKNFNKNWKGYVILNACLTGSGANQGESIYRWEFNKKNEKLKKKNKYYIGDRIRDMKYSKKDNSLLLVLENQKALGIIFEN
tara:strand:+ start:1818 stop:3134 length:1317 start_codon:yes stop_codon:yes gene_type:complete